MLQSNRMVVGESAVAVAQPAAVPRAKRPPRELSREMQVQQVLKLLETRGPKSAVLVKKRIKSGAGVAAKGIHFDSSVLQEALDHWNSQRSHDCSKERSVATPLKKAAIADDSAPALLKRKAADAEDSPGASLPAASFGPAVASPKKPRPEPAEVIGNGDAFSSALQSAANMSLRSRLAIRTGGVKVGFPATPQQSRLGNGGIGVHQLEDVSVQHLWTMKSVLARSPKSVPAPTPEPVSSPQTQPEPVLSDRTAPSSLSPERPSPTVSSAPEPVSASPEKNIRELKDALASNDIDTSGCVEKADLQALWERYRALCCLPLQDLKDMCRENGGLAKGRSLFSTSEACARFILKATSVTSVQVSTAASVTSSAALAATPAPAAHMRNAQLAARGEQSRRVHGADEREQDASREVRRIVPLRRAWFPDGVTWGFSVLDIEEHELAAVQRAYRNLMKKLHPDKVGNSPGVDQAVEMIREAKELCERALSKEELPEAPRCLKSTMLCDIPGRRRIRLSWSSPEPRVTRPVRRYIVAVVDPAYGRALTIRTLEPDYNEDLRRFVPVEELDSYVLAEEELQKMPKFWQQARGTVKIAAANNIGQSLWAEMAVSLGKPHRSSAGPKRGRITDYST